MGFGNFLKKAAGGFGGAKAIAGHLGLRKDKKAPPRPAGGMPPDAEGPTAEQALPARGVARAMMQRKRRLPVRGGLAR